MKSWFTIEKIDDETFAISEYKHIEKPHSYLLIGSNRALLIDSGLGVGNIRKEVEKLTDLNITVISTHVHWDHVGGHILFKDHLVHKSEKNWFKNKPVFNLECIKNNLKRGIDKFPEEFNMDNYEIFYDENIKTVKDEDIIDLGNRKIKVIHTPGHSPGHMCFYDFKNKYLFTGDMIYKGTIYLFFPTSDPVIYKKSLKKIRNLDIKKILPGHGDLKVSLNMINEISNAFDEIEKDGLLRQGSGKFEYEDFNILL